MNVLRVLLVSPKPPPSGGIQTWTEHILAEATLHPGIELHHVDIAPRWRQVYQTGYARRVTGGTAQGLRDVVRILRLLRRCRFDALSITSSGGLAAVRDLAVLHIAKAHGVRAYHHLRVGRLPEVVEHAGWEWTLLRRVMRTASAVVVLDEASRRAAVSADPALAVHKIPNCVSTAHLASSSASPHAREVLFVGWIVETKGVRELVEAWRSLRVPGTRMTMIGPGDPGLIKKLKDLADEGQGTPSLEIVGELSHVATMERISRADIVVLPSYSEGFPNVIAEAMAYGKAIVATSVGAIPEMLAVESDAPAGIVIPPHDTSSLRVAIERLLRDRSLCDELGARARERVEAQYSVPRVFERLVSLWQGEAQRLGSAQDVVGYVTPSIQDG